MTKQEKTGKPDCAHRVDIRSTLVEFVGPLQPEPVKKSATKKTSAKKSPTKKPGTKKTSTNKRPVKKHREELQLELFS